MIKKIEKYRVVGGMAASSGDRVPNLYRDNNTGKYYGAISYKGKVHRIPHCIDRESVIRDLELKRIEISEMKTRDKELKSMQVTHKKKAREPIKYADTFKPYKDLSHPFLVNLRNTRREVVTQAAVSEEDCERVKAHKWHLNSGYACGTINKNTISMHQFILGTPEDGYVVDHIDKNRLNNTRTNLRFATRGQNGQNTTRTSGKTYTGVYLSKGKYVAKYAGIHLGQFINEEDAARVYDIYVFQREGRYSTTNGLVSYEEALSITLNIPSENKKNRDLPPYIYRCGKWYIAQVRYENVLYRSSIAFTVANARRKLSKIQAKIQTLIRERELARLQQSITRNEEGVAIILTSKGDEILVDDDMWHKLSQHGWCLSNGYANARVNRKGFTMHRYVMFLKMGEEIPKRMIVDHINHNKIDNRTTNLRIGDHSMNNHNKRKKTTRKSKYVGVTKRRNKYCAKAQKGGEVYYLGSFLTEREAVVAYNNKVIELHGANANLNIIEDE